MRLWKEQGQESRTTCFEDCVNESHAIAGVPGAAQRAEAYTPAGSFHSLCEGKVVKTC